MEKEKAGGVAIGFSISQFSAAVSHPVPSHPWGEGQDEGRSARAAYCTITMYSGATVELTVGRVTVLPLVTALRYTL